MRKPYWILFLSALPTWASVLVAWCMATLVVVVGGLMVYSICKFAKRVDNGQPYRKEGVHTNGTGVDLPPGEIRAGAWRDARLWFEWDHELPTGGGVPATEPEPARGIALYTALVEDYGVVLRLGWPMELDMRPRSWGELGMSVDEVGIPILNWSYGQMPSSGAVQYTVERSTNLIDWEPVITWELAEGTTNVWMEPLQPCMFYRVKP